ncbi:S-layer homology domain-containing protein [Serinibacter salmoneus]|uniref:S-layer family protein n=1 Tax=Serinibacter salmoneus TaxID=556530 RepID=A0A2A9D3C3_9MICO|nr:S-layer homology domain-containing protein [Serinibacter salmoneus]PFG20891.1 S-layer family protein [Serinibacter salmoneus]
MRLLRTLAATAALALSATLSLAGVTPATAAVTSSQYDAGMIVSDATFYDWDSMTSRQVQDFLDSKVSRCRPEYSAGPHDPIVCLKDYVMTTRDVDASGGCEAIVGGRRSAAEIIVEVGRACGVSPRSLLVLLQRESGLVTHVAPSTWRYDEAMGYGCPDGAPCAAEYEGFFNQVYRAAWQFRRYQAYPSNYSFQAGRTNSISYHPSGTCGRQSVYIQNQATAGLYNYTPYVPNNALKNGSPNGCSSYGNLNFFLLINNWFEGVPTASSPFRDVSTTNQFFNEIDWLYSEQITTGWRVSGGREYRPLEDINRDAMAAFLYRLAGSPSYTPPRTSPFSDVSTSNRYYKEISWLYAEGISTGWGSGSTREFRPLEQIDRDAMAAFLYRMAGEPRYSAPGTSPFADVSTRTMYYKEIAWLASEGISTGWSTSSGQEFRPGDAVARDAMAAFLYRFDRM